MQLRQRGFSLIEVIMIIVVAAIAIPVLLVVLGQQARLSVEPELHITSSNLGQALLEEIKAREFDNVDSYNGYSDTQSLGGVQYSRAVEVCNVPGANLNDTTQCGANTDYKRIKVTVSSSQGSLELVTLMTDN